MKKVIRGSIFYAILNPVVGSEQGGYRPVLVLQNDKGNKYSHTTIIAPITKRLYKGKLIPTHVLLKPFDKVRPNSIVLLEQIRTIDKSRLKGFVGVVDESEMKRINKAVCKSLGIEREIEIIWKNIW